MPLITMIVVLIAVLLVVGVLLWALNNLPFIDPAMASIARVVIIVFMVIALAFWMISAVGAGAVIAR